ncbi:MULTISPECIES: alkaline phosphatase family protein [unclassified Bacillus (in: firmicutes)]|uniref:alkaline phosphatase family protein n=1 Tax=unclassified Bacillus (in: firmicutes) TaxID=185979 RepID=UPI0008E2E0F1|nr:MULTISPECIES: ectonucleotide pyrophosphatase/phosphodiesterase [unclassified Bacillus (in: firmicutes)]SFA90095.1 Predicted pyrophosphatase or phosphodiesterase, AlkP superfamily [Bacillus sp. UNCCL13]SFQ85141.1 Predicted pyrophosphatase or phosphodiesterase, AlkP superfamily [Bacillus sp. cl95]
MKRLTDHLIVISFDCLSALDLPILQELPHFKKFMKKAALAPQVKSIYPSVTYPCHTSIITGNYPVRHGVINNTLLQPGWLSPDWNWHRQAIKGTTVYDEVKKAGMTTAALLWPVTAKANIDYNMPEIFPNRPWQNQILVSLMNGSPFYQIDLNRRFGKLRRGIMQPELDDFVLESTVHTIKTKKPNLLLVHFTDLDSMRHYHGFSSTEATEALHRHDHRLGRITEAIEEAGISENSTLVLLGDHSALDENHALHINVLFHQHGLITVNEKGKLKDWQAYCKSCDGSAYIYVKNKNDSDTILKVKNILEELHCDEKNGIERILTGEQAASKGADPECSFMIEARKGYYFLEDFEGDYVKKITPQDIKSDKKYTMATHGYSPEKEDYSTIFMAAGKGIRSNAVIKGMHLVDEGPIFAKLLGVSLGETDGKVIEDLLDLS